jgi:hypothetical protein
MRTSWVKLLILAVLLLLAAAAAKDKPKPWTQWNVEDARKVLNDSPWGQTQSYLVYPDIMTAANTSTGTTRDPFVYFRIRFISAKPIRQAILRTLELSPSKVTPQQIEDARGYLDRKFDQTIVVAVAFDTPDRMFFGPVFQAFSSAVAATLKNNTFLELDNGKRAFLQEYQPPDPDGLGAMFIFPRMVDNALFITPNAGSVRFFALLPLGNRGQSVDPFTGQILGNVTQSRILLNMKFKIADFKYDGVMEY